MPGSTPRTLNISAGKLSQNVNLVFSWGVHGSPASQLVVWRSLNYESNDHVGEQNQQIKYNNNFRFIMPVVSGNRIISEYAFMDIENSNETTIIPVGDVGAVSEFTEPTYGRPGAVFVRNETEWNTNIAFGFPPEKPGEVNAALYWPGVPPKDPILVNWQPILYAYAFVGGKPYQNNDIVHEFGADSIWYQWLDRLPEVSHWILEEKNGKYTLNKPLEK